MNTNITLVSARWLVPIEPRNTVLAHHSVAVENGSIVEILPSDVAKIKYQGAQMLERPDHVLMPGMVNSHTHAAMCLFRGLADDIALGGWLNDYIWPAEAQWVDADFIRDGTQLAIAEMLHSGTTSFTDMYFSPDVAAKTTQDMGMRATISLPVLDFPSPWGSGPEEYFEKGLATQKQIAALSLIETAFAPHAPYTISDGPLSQVLKYVDELQLPMHMHIHEAEQEVIDAVAQSGKRPLQRLNDLGLLTPRMIAVHMTQLTEQEIEMVAEQGVHVVHCPISNAKLASGVCPVSALLDAGANVCLGTDGAASNNNLDMFIEMRAAAMAAKLQSRDARVLPAWQVLEMATINGAKAVNQQHIYGSLVAGKAADMIAVDFSHFATQPVYDPISQLVYSASRQQVSDVWVNGKHLLKDRSLVEIDEKHLFEKVEAWGNKIGALQ